MARYCFYCGRELNAGEKCNCRSGGETSEKKTDSKEPKEHARSTASASGDTSETYAGRAGSRPESGKAHSEKQTNKTHSSSRPGASHQSSRPRGAGRPFFANLNLRSLRAPLAQVWQYVVRPADSMASAAAGSASQPVALVMAIKGLVGGLFFLIVINRTLLKSVIVIPGLDNAGFMSGLVYFLLGFCITLASSLLIALLYFVLLRFVYRRPASFRQLMAGLCPSFFYVTIFLLLALLAIGSTIFNAAMLLVAGYAISVLAQAMALRETLGQGENRGFSLVVMVQILYVSILATVLNLGLPMLRALLESSPPV
jgi:hypothetical protein